MKNNRLQVFLSWSKEESLSVAKVFAEWLPLFFYEADYFLSTNIKKGTEWRKEVLESCHDADFGIIFFTKDNCNNAWLMFESGALSMNAEVAPFLFNIKHADIPDNPISSMQLTQYEDSDVGRNEVFKLLESINNTSEIKLGHKLVQDKDFQSRFNKLFPKLKCDLSKIVLEAQLKDLYQNRTEASVSETSFQEQFPILLTTLKEYSQFDRIKSVYEIGEEVIERSHSACTTQNNYQRVLYARRLRRFCETINDALALNAEARSLPEGVQLIRWLTNLQALCEKELRTLDSQQLSPFTNEEIKQRR